MNDIQIFNNPVFGKVRTTLSASNEPLFCLADVCKALDISNVSQCKSRLKQPGVTTNEVGVVTGKKADGTDAIQYVAMSFITEPNLYKCIFQSRRPDAEKFQDWVCDDVLPSIRKTGGYIATDSTMTDDEIMARALIVAQNTIDCKNKLIEESQKQVLSLSREVTEMQPKANYYDIILNSKGTVTTTQVAQDYGVSAKYFNKQLELLHIQHKVNGQWILYAPYLSQGYVHAKPVDIIRSDGRHETKLNTEWTQKGRNFIYNKLKNIDIIPLIEK